MWRGLQGGPIPNKLEKSPNQISTLSTKPSDQSHFMKLPFSLQNSTILLIPQTIIIQLLRRVKIRQLQVQKMLFSKSRAIKFPSQLNIHQLQLAFDDTVVILYQRMSSNHSGASLSQELIVMHVSETGKTIHQYSVQSDLHEMVMPSEKVVLVPLIAKNIITVIDLYAKTSREVQCKFQGERKKQFFVFEASRMFCVKQFLFDKTAQIKLTYFNTHDIEQSILQKSIPIQKQSEEGFRREVAKGNNHSLVILFNKIETNYFQLTLHQIQEGNKSAVRVVRVTVPRVSDGIFPIWLIRNNQLLFCPPVIEQEEDLKIFSLTDSSQRDVGCKFPIWHFHYRICFLSQFLCLKEFYLNYNNEEAVHSLNYISTDSQKMEFHDKDVSKRLKVDQVKVSDHNSSVLVEWVLDEDKGKLMLRKLLLFGLMDIYMHLLEHIDQEFDDDLLQDAMILLDCV